MTRDEERQRCFDQISDAVKAMDIANRTFSAKDAELANARISDNVERQRTPNDHGAVQKSLEYGQKVKREWDEAKMKLDAARQEFQNAHKAQEHMIARHVREDQANTAARF